MKVAFIGNINSKCGIAVYNELLFNALKEFTEIKFFSERNGEEDNKDITYCWDREEFPKLSLIEKIDEFKPDVYLAFEVVEHVDCFDACYQLLRPGGKMLITTPVPEMDWLLKITESLGLNQKRTSPHDHLVDLQNVPFFNQKKIKIVLGLGQWAVFTK
jgi:hypothetical protein